MDELTERAARQVVDAALKVHRALGTGLLESAYEHCLARKLFLRKVPFQRQLHLPITYEGVTLEAAYRLDLVVDDRVVVEVKSLDGLLPIHEA